MKRLFYYIGSLLLIISISCDRKETNPEQYLTAIIDGEKFQASYLYAFRKYSEYSRSIDLYASKRDIFDSEFSYETLQSNDDYKLFLFSFQNDCVAERLFSWDEINTDTACVECMYEFFDSYFKAITPQFFDSDGFIEIESVDYEENGIITGSFEITGRNYIILDFTDTIYIRDGEFRLKFRN